MSKFFIPKSGDTVRVRLRDGRAVDAVYIEPSTTRKCHRVKFGRLSYLLAQDMKPMNEFCCRFIGPACTLQEIAK